MRKLFRIDKQLTNKKKLLTKIEMDIESLGKDRGSKVSFSSGRESYLSLEALTDPRLSHRQKASLIE